MERIALKYSTFGDPLEVLELVQETISCELGEHEVLVRWLASPVHPADINKINGVYFYQDSLPAIAGSEGSGRVIKTGAAVTRVAPGDKVIIFSPSSPCWASQSVVEEYELIKVDQRLNPLQAASIIGNPSAAWLMINMGGLERGDWLIQNSANSAVGRAVIEMAKNKGYHTINIVRDRPNIAELKAELLRLGGDVVWTEDEVMSEGRAFKERPKLGLNGVGGKSCLRIANLLCRGGTLITYGGMSKKAHEFSTSALVFNNIKVVGVINLPWMSDPTNEKEFDRMLREIQDLYIRGALHPPPMEEHPLENYKVALENTIDGKHAKQIFIIRDETISKL